MTESIELYAAYRKNGKIYLGGTACGNAGKYYCIDYGGGDDSGYFEGQVINNVSNFTLFSGGKCIDMEEIGAYIPDHGDYTYRIYLDEVEAAGCEHSINWVGTSTLYPEDLPPVEDDLLFGLSAPMVALGAVGIAAAAAVIVQQTQE